MLHDLMGAKVRISLAAWTVGAKGTALQLDRGDDSTAGGRTGIRRWNPGVEFSSCRMGDRWRHPPYNQPAGKLLRFWHQRIREYLTAHHIERRGFEAFLSGASMDSAWWAETINMLAAVTASPRKMLLATLDSLKPDRKS